MKPVESFDAPLGGPEQAEPSTRANNSSYPHSEAPLTPNSAGSAAERREAPPAVGPLPSLSDFNSNELMMRSICAVGAKRAKSIRLPKGCVSAGDGILLNQEFFVEDVGYCHGDVPGVWMQIFRDGSTFTEFVEGFEMVSGARWNQLQPGHKKSAFCLFENIRVMFDRHGLENFGFETFTFPRKVHDIREAQRHWNSLNTGVYRKLNSPAIMTPERHKDGGVHFHCIVHLGHDVRTGFDFAQVADKSLPRKVRYQSVCPWLKERWRLWREELCPRYGFGRHELMPIRTQANAVARYLGGYIRKQIENRNEVDKGSRLVRYIGFGPGERTHYPTFAWVVQGRPWRLALGEFAPSQNCHSFDDLAHKFGKAWAWGWGPLIMRDARLLEMLGAEVEDSCPDLVRAYREFCVESGLASVDLSKPHAVFKRMPCPARILKLFAEMGDE